MTSISLFGDHDTVDGAHARPRTEAFRDGSVAEGLAHRRPDESNGVRRLRRRRRSATVGCGDPDGSLTRDLITVGTAAAAVASAVVARIMFAFSTSVMPALRWRPAPERIAATQAANSAILNPAFGLVFGAAALLCTVLALAAPFTVDEPHAVLRGVGAALYVVGTFGDTVAINVPMKFQLESADADSPEARAVWHRYLSRWTAWTLSLDPRCRRLRAAGRLAGVNLRVRGERRRQPQQQRASASGTVAQPSKVGRWVNCTVVPERLAQLRDVLDA